jgi:hypothetical protein
MKKIKTKLHWEVTENFLSWAIGTLKVEMENTKSKYEKNQIKEKMFGLTLLANQAGLEEMVERLKKDISVC